MSVVAPAPLVDQLKWRYAVKLFDSARKIPSDVWRALEDSLVLSPSSYGIQPWKFFVVADPELRARLKPVSWGQSQVVEASHFVVFAVRDTLTDTDLDRYISRIVEVRGGTVEALSGLKKMMQASIKGHGNGVFDWNARQAYIALGGFMTAAAALGVDTCPMEGLDAGKYDEILGLPAKGYRTVVACAAGYRAAGDKYASAPKVRFHNNEVVETL